MTLADQWITLLLGLVLFLFLAGILAVLWYFRQHRPPPTTTQATALDQPKAPVIIELKTYDVGGQTVARPQERSRLRHMPRALRKHAPRIVPKIGINVERRQLLVIVGGSVLAAVAGIALLIIAMPSLQRFWYTDQFVVVVAAFDDGGDGTTGVAVARELEQVLRESHTHDMHIFRTSTRPTDEAMARQIAQHYTADVVIWGYTRPGETLNRVAMLPRITFQPTGAHAPYGWAGFQTRLAQPTHYILATAPINGQLVLPTVIDALYRYSKGDADQAHAIFGTLLERHPLHPALPHTLRGNVEWARGQYAQAAGEYRAALAQASPEQALLTHNLWVSLLEANDPLAEAIFPQIWSLLGTAPLPQLHTNLGVIALRDSRPDDARRAFETAQSQLDQLQQRSPLGLRLLHSRACRESGDLACAEEQLAHAGRIRNATINSVPTSTRDRQRAYVEAALAEERGLLALTVATDAPGPLLWAVEASPPLTTGELRRSGELLRQATRHGEDRVRLWEQASTARAASLSSFGLGVNRTAGATVEVGQQRRAADDLRRMQYHYLLQLIESERAVQHESQGVIALVWNNLFQMATPLAEARRLTRTLLADNPDDMFALLGEARALRIRNSSPNDLAEAEQMYDRLRRMHLTRPEPLHGIGAIALQRGDTTTARQLMQESLTLDASFFPAYAALAQTAREAGDLRGAIEYLRVLVQFYPRHAYTLALASVLREAGPEYHAEAMRVLQPMLAMPHAGAWTEQGRIERDAGQQEQAIASLTTAAQLRQGSYSAEAQFELGLLHIQRGEHAAAERNLHNATRHGNERTRLYAHLALANLYNNILHQPKQAIPHFDAVVRANTDDVLALIAIADQLRWMDETNRAFDALARARVYQPDNPDILVRLAQVQLDLRSYRAAENDAQQVLRLTNDGRLPWQRSMAQVVLGDVRRLRGDFAAAQEFYNQAQQTDPNNVAAFIAPGLVAIAQDNWAVAAGYFEQAVSLPRGQNDALAHFWAAEGRFRMGDLGRAMNGYERAISLREPLPFPAAWLGKAQTYLALGNPQAAQAAVAQALQQDPDYAEAWFFKGKLAEAQGDLDEARKAYDRTIQADGRITPAFFRRGLIHMQQERYRDARRDFDRVVANEPNNAEAHYWMGRAQIATGDTELALRSFQQASELSGGTLAVAQLYTALATEQIGNRESAVNLLLGMLQTSTDPAITQRVREELQRIQSDPAPNLTGNVNQ